MTRYQSVLGLAAFFLAATFSLPVAALPCGSVVTSDTTLTRNVGPCTGTALYIVGDNISLNLNGYIVHSVAGLAGNPINANGLILNGSIIDVRNGRIQGFGRGVTTSSASIVLLENLIISNSGTAVLFSGGYANFVSNSRIERARVGVHLKGQTGNFGGMDFSVVEDVDWGVHLDGCRLCFVGDNIFRVRQASVRSSNSDASNVIRNLFFGGFAGILVNDAKRLSVRENSFYDSSMSGILVEPTHSWSSVPNLSIRRNNFYDIPFAIDFFGGQGITRDGRFYDNLIYGGTVGIWIDSVRHQHHVIVENRLIEQSWRPFMDNGLGTVYQDNLCDGAPCP